MDDYKSLAEQKYHKHKRLKYIKNKYSDAIEFDKTKRVNSRIVRFCKKHFFPVPLNMSNTEIEQIPSIFRFRFYLYSGRLKEEIMLINEIYNIECQSLDDCDDEYMKNTILNIQIEDKKNKIIDAKKKFEMYPVIIDLRIHGQHSEIPIIFNTKEYIIRDDVQDKIKKAYNKICSNTTISERFYQMLQWSKVLSKNYNRIINPPPPPPARVLQKAIQSDDSVDSI